MLTVNNENAPLTGNPPPQTRIVFKNRPKPAFVPHNFPPVEEFPDYSIPLHDCWGGRGKEFSKLNLPLSPIQRNRDYERDLNNIFWEDGIEHNFNVVVWALYSPLLPANRNRKQWAPGNDDEKNPVFFGFFVTANTLGNWKFVHRMLEGLLRHAFGPARPPIRYFVAENLYQVYAMG